MGARHALRLVVFDMEGTLTAAPTVWELMHREIGTWESHGLKYWQQYCAGEIAYDAFARMDVAVWRGAPVAALDRAVKGVPLMEGCAQLLNALHSHGVRTAIVSNGLLRMADRLVSEQGVSTAMANRAHVRDGALTGELDILVPYEAKGHVTRRLMDAFGVGPTDTAAVGDSRADAAMFAEVGLGVAFCPSDPLAAPEADHVVATPDLCELLPLLLSLS